MPPCSDTNIGWYPVLVLEGMPGAGKTSAATALAAQNWTVIGEYTTVTGGVVPIHAHPAVNDDAGHQHNWLRKHHQVHAARRNGPVFCDRAWLSALAYAYSVADTDQGELLHSRARWASDCLDHGVLTLASTYIVFQLDPNISLHRRTNRLTPRHPWAVVNRPARPARGGSSVRPHTGHAGCSKSSRNRRCERSSRGNCNKIAHWRAGPSEAAVTARRSRSPEAARSPPRSASAANFLAC